jgi:fructan beta-fructosidase
VFWLDHGSDFYAAVTWSNVPDSDGRRILLGWMSNWAYTQDVPTTPWRSAMTFPRLLALRRTSEGLRLTQQPVDELKNLREKPTLVFPGGSFADADNWLHQQGDLSELLDVEMVFSDVFPTAPFVINIHAAAGEITSIGIDSESAKLAVDRTHSGLKEFHPAFLASCRHEAPMPIFGGRLTLRFLLDRSSLEVFAQDGGTTLTDLIFPTAGRRSIGLSSQGGNALSMPKVDRISIHALRYDPAKFFLKNREYQRAHPS